MHFPGGKAVMELISTRKQNNAAQDSCYPVVLHCWNGLWHGLGQLALSTIPKQAREIKKSHGLFLVTTGSCQTFFWKMKTFNINSMGVLKMC